MIINRIYETQNLLSLQLDSFLVGLRTYQHPCILFDGENISFDASLVIYINSTNIPPIIIINRIYETQNLLSLQLVSFLVGLRTYQHPCTVHFFLCISVYCADILNDTSIQIHFLFTVYLHPIIQIYTLLLLYTSFTLQILIITSHYFLFLMQRL